MSALSDHPRISPESLSSIMPPNFLEVGNGRHARRSDLLRRNINVDLHDDVLVLRGAVGRRAGGSGERKLGGLLATEERARRGRMVVEDGCCGVEALRSGGLVVGERGEGREGWGGGYDRERHTDGMREKTSLLTGLGLRVGEGAWEAGGERCGCGVGGLARRGDILAEL